MQYTKFLSILLLISCIANGFYCAKLQEKFRWKEVSYAWPSESAKVDAIKTGRYQPENNLPLGLDVWGNRLFITVPRFVCILYIQIISYVMHDINVVNDKFVFKQKKIEFIDAPIL